MSSLSLVLLRVLKNIYSPGKISHGRQSWDLCFPQRRLALFLQVHHNLGENPLLFFFSKRRQKGKASHCFLTPLSYCPPSTPHCPLSFPGAQKSSWEEKKPTPVFLAYKWLIIFGSAAAGPPPPFSSTEVWMLLSLCLSDSHPTLWRDLLVGVGRIFFWHT